MNEHEDYFRFSKNGDVHTLSNRIPFKWKELLLWTSASFIFTIYFLGLAIGIYVAILTLIGYIFYRFAAWIYYSEIKINDKNGKMTRLKKILNRTHKTELITENFDSSRFEYADLSRSGKNKFLIRYNTHKKHDLLILKNKKDKEKFKEYIEEKIAFTTKVQ